MRFLFFLGHFCEGAPPAGGGGENLATTRKISGNGKVLSLSPLRGQLPHRGSQV